MCLVKQYTPMQVGTDFVGLAGSKSMTLRAPGLEQAGAFGSVTWVIREAWSVYSVAQIKE